MDISGTITAPIERSPRGSVLLLSDICFLSPPGPLQTRGKMRLFVPHPKEKTKIFFRPGDKLKTFARIKIPRNFANPGTFDYVSYLARDEIYLLGSVKSCKLLTLEESKSWKWAALMADLRQRITDAVQERLSHSEVENRIAHFLLAITIGNREGLTREDKKLLSRGGIYHIVAISGLHVGLIAWMTFSLLTLLRFPDRWASFFTVALLFAYLPLSGGRSSAARAVLMATLYLISRIIRRPSHVLTTISFSALILLLVKPQWLFDPGFQLTFAATISIILFLPMLSQSLPAVRILRTPLLLSFSAQIGVIPILAYHFNTILWISLLTNLVILPLMIFILPLSFTWEAILFVNGSLSEIILPPLIVLMKSVFWIASLYENVPFLSYRIPDPPLYLIALYYLFAWALQYVRQRCFKIMFLTLFLLFLILITSYPFPPASTELFEVTFIDVGQGESAFLVSQEGTSILIDGGGRWGERFDAGEMVVSKFLWHRGRKTIDMIILSHLHADHAGGVPSILENFSVGNIVLSEREKEEPFFAEIKDLCLKRKTQIHFVEEEFIIHFDHFHIKLFQGDFENTHFSEGNERSLIAKVTCGGIRFLFTGDAPSHIEKAMVESGRDLRSDILKVGHHGSNDASSQAFLDAVQPELCIISCGADNRWGHPKAQVLERIGKIGAELYRTDQDGAITVRTDKKSYKTESYLKKFHSPSLNTEP